MGGHDDWNVDAETARAELAATEQHAGSTTRAAKRFVWRWYLGMGAGFAAWILIAAAVHQWVGGSIWVRSLMTGVGLAVAFALAMRPAFAQPVRAGVNPLRRLATIALPLLPFIATMAIGDGVPLAYPIGAVVVFACFAGSAWWASR